MCHLGSVGFNTGRYLLLNFVLIVHEDTVSVVYEVQLLEAYLFRKNILNRLLMIYIFNLTNHQYFQMLNKQVC